MFDKIDRNSWHWKIYAFNSQLVHAWLGKDFYYEYPKQREGEKIGLCPYMRMIILWGPLVMLTYLAPLAAFYGALIYFPYSANAGLGLLALFGTLLAISGVIWLLAWLAVKREEETWEQREAREEARERRLKENPGFLRLFWRWLVAQKTKICPVMEVE